jgi:hypothetical protein
LQRGARGRPAVLVTPISSEFAPEDNPQASNILLMAIGGHASASLASTIRNISNGSGNAETSITVLHFTNLVTRFRENVITAGTRDAILMALAICDGSVEANDQVTFLPPIAGASPTIAGGLAALPCIASKGTDGLNTGIGGAMIVIPPPLSKFVRIVRLWVDLCTGVSGAGAQTCTGPNRYAVNGGGNGILFEQGELVQQVIPRYNPATGEAIAIFGQRQDQVLFTTSGMPIVAADPLCANGNALVALPNGAQACGSALGPANPNPLILIATADIGEDAVFPASVSTAEIVGPQSQPIENIPRSCGPGKSHVIYPGTESFLDCTITGAVIAVDNTPQGTNGPRPTGFDTSSGNWGSNFMMQGPETHTLHMYLSKSGASFPPPPPPPSQPHTLSKLDLLIAAYLNSDHSIRFMVHGNGIASLWVQVYDLSGKAVYNGTTNGSTLTFNGLGADGQPLANGVYLYIISVTDADGHTVTSKVRKLVILR